ncbi:MAG: peroxiredoxin family protein, partial [Phycisphaerales bacterium]
NESAQAVKNVKGLSYKSKLYGLGALKPIMDGEGEVLQVRPSVDVKTSMMWIKGSVAEIGKGKTNVLVTTNGRTIRWQDDPSNTVYERPSYDRNDAARVLGLGSQIVLPEFKDPMPMMKELAAPELKITGEDKVHGESCKVVVASWDGGIRSTTYWISVNDKLPRKVELAHGANNPDPEKRLAKGIEVWDLRLRPELSEADLKIPVPKGFAEDVQAAPQPKLNQDFNNQPAQPAGPIPDPVIMLPANTEAPDFELKNTAGNTVKLSDAGRGQVVVLSFWGTRFPKSTTTNNVIQSLTDSYKDKNVKFFGIACREENDDAAKSFASAQKWTFPILLSGDPLCTPYRVVGFPSTVVIDGQGKVSKCFQGPVNKDSLEMAIQSAIKGDSK